jgi:MFS transporter, Spinster family, sphingosine-1-phosphate transporter
LVRDEMRATTLAVVMLLANLIGMGVGPQVVGILSDVLRSSAGANSLRYAMLIVSLIALLAAHQFWRAAGTVKEDLGAVAAPPRPPAEDAPAGFHSGAIKPAR